MCSDLFENIITILAHCHKCYVQIITVFTEREWGASSQLESRKDASVAVTLHSSKYTRRWTI